jgi:hypothetical protein
VEIEFRRRLAKCGLYDRALDRSPPLARRTRLERRFRQDRVGASEAWGWPRVAEIKEKDFEASRMTPPWELNFSFALAKSAFFERPWSACLCLCEGFHSEGWLREGRVGASEAGAGLASRRLWRGISSEPHDSAVELNFSFALAKSVSSNGYGARASYKRRIPPLKTVREDRLEASRHGAGLASPR